MCFIYNISLHIPFKEVKIISGCWRWQPVTEFNNTVKFRQLNSEFYSFISFCVVELQWLYTVLITRIYVVSSSESLNTKILMYCLHIDMMEFKKKLIGIQRYTFTGQKFFCTKIFPYIFHIKPLNFKHSLEVISYQIFLKLSPLKAELITLLHFNIFIYCTFFQLYLPAFMI